MPLSKLPTLTKYLIEQRRRYPDASGDFNSLVLDISIAFKAISRQVSLGLLAGNAGTGTTNVHGEAQKPLDLISNDMLLRQTEWDGFFAGVVSEEMDEPYQIPAGYPRGKYLLLTDPLDGSSNIDVNVSVGTIFSILRAPDDVIESGRDVVAEDFLQPGARQMAAGYAIYGPTTMLVLTVGHGVAGFTLDPNLGEFKLTHPDIRVPEETQEFAINTSNSRFWEAPVRRYVDECLQGKTGPRSKDFNMRWIASLVAEAHRILMRGGVFMYPRDTRDLSKPGRLRLLYEANPIGMLIEQAGGRASNGRQPILDIEPRDLHQRMGFVFGSKSEVERIEQYHLHPEDAPLTAPLFAERSLFRD
jgi:fructose-1,6-bisphosphatase I/sedoheptulose-1,7-bisphosphatase